MARITSSNASFWSGVKSEAYLKLTDESVDIFKIPELNTPYRWAKTSKL